MAMRPSTKAWIALGVGVAIWELAAPEGELLSHGFDNFLEKHPVVTWTITMATVLHLLNIMPSWADAWNLVHHLRRLRGA